MIHGMIEVFSNKFSTMVDLKDGNLKFGMETHKVSMKSRRKVVTHKVGWWKKFLCIRLNFSTSLY